MHHIRNFTIIAHIDHGKSTLADRMLEITGTIPLRKMKEQILDSMELERERGITIKMQPVRMLWHSGGPEQREGQEYVLNLIDTPGHIDFYYEVSRALKAVEGSILLVDATQGVQAQTLTTLAMARELGLTIIPVVSKIDSPLARVDDVRAEVATLLECSSEAVLGASGKTGEGVNELLSAVINRIPAPKKVYEKTNGFRALVFDFQYSNHRGVIFYVRVLDGKVAAGDDLDFIAAGRHFSALEVGIFKPEEVPAKILEAGEIGYIVTGIKEAGIASVGDTITSRKYKLPAVAGYMTPLPVVWASLYSESDPGDEKVRTGGDDFAFLRQALARLKLSDSSFSYEEETSGSLGRGFRCGFLGMLHLEIIVERLKREFKLDLIVTTPSITYDVHYKNGKVETVYTPHRFPDESLIATVNEPWVRIKVIAPVTYIGPIIQLLFEHEAETGETENFGDARASITARLPLRELMRNFFDTIKSITAGYASISYEIDVMRPADVVRLDLLVADEIVPAFSRVVSRRRVQAEGEQAVQKLSEILPRQLFLTKIQAKALGRIIASETLSALKKDVTGYLYGGDITRKKKLWEKQKKGKKRMKERGTVNIPHDVFLKMMRNSG